MTTEERKVFDALLKKIGGYEDECLDKIKFLAEHNFSFEKQAMNMKLSAYHDCFRELRQALQLIDRIDQPLTK